jgi:hypothetical protein
MTEEIISETKTSTYIKDITSKNNESPRRGIKNKNKFVFDLT